MRITKRFLWLSPVLLVAGCHSPYPYANSTQIISAADYTTPEIVLTNSGEPLVASAAAVTVVPSEVYAPNPAADPSDAKAATQPLQPDSLLLARVRQQLSQVTTLAPIAAHLHIDAENGTVRLVGSVPDDDAKERIEAQINEIPGVTSIDDQLQIAASEPPPPSEPAPITPAAVVTSVPAANPDLTPTGVLPGGTNRVYAPESAAATATVLSSNSFNVHVQSAVGSDGTLAQRIVQELQRDAALVPVLQTVEVNLADGQIQLRGTVRNEEQKERVQSAVQRVTGIANVDNQLRVSNPATR